MKTLKDLEIKLKGHHTQRGAVLRDSNEKVTYGWGFIEAIDAVETLLKDMSVELDSILGDELIEDFCGWIEGEHFELFKNMQDSMNSYMESKEEFDEFQDWFTPFYKIQVIQQILGSEGGDE